MNEPLNPSFCCGCRWWNYRCAAPPDNPCENTIPAEVFLRTAHTRADVQRTIQETEQDIRRKARTGR